MNTVFDNVNHDRATFYDGCLFCLFVCCCFLVCLVLVFGGFCLIGWLVGWLVFFSLFVVVFYLCVLLLFCVCVV